MDEIVLVRHRILYKRAEYHSFIQFLSFRNCNKLESYEFLTRTGKSHWHTVVQGGVLWGQLTKRLTSYMIRDTLLTELLG
jgi:hypothetical protein